LLKEPDLQIREIAERCGFDSQQRFAQAFGRMLGESASAYRAGRVRLSQSPSRLTWPFGDGARASARPDSPG